MRGVIAMQREFPVRKHPRLKGYDYSKNGAYFITFCVKDRHEMLGRVVGRGILDAPRFTGYDSPDAPRVELSEYGTNLCKAVNYMDDKVGNITVDKYIVMPNHVHLIVAISDTPDGASGKPRPTNALIPKFISSIKRYTNKLAGFDMWQSSYHDHIIRDQASYNRIWQYIDENPSTWQQDCYHPK